MKSKLALLGGDPVITEKHRFSWPPINDSDIEAVVSLLRRNEISYYGREGEAKRLEERFCDYLGIPHALATSSGTTALHSAYFAIGLEPGDEVLVPTYTFLATVMPLFLVNAVPVFVDADPLTGNIAVDDIEHRITSRTRAIVVTHLWGQPCDMRRIMEIARRHGLRVVEDCSHAHGAECYGKKVGSFGDVSVFSLQGKKLVAAGQGGMLVSHDRTCFERAVLLGHFKVRSFQDVQSSALKQYAATGFGMNYRMHPFASALANSQFDRLEQYIAGRRANLEYLSLRLEGIPGVRPPHVHEFVDRHVWYSYKPMLEPSDLPGIPVDLYVQALVAEGVDVELSETKPLHLEPIFQDGSAHPMRSHGRNDLIPGRPQLQQSSDPYPGAHKYSMRALVLPAFTEEKRDLMDMYAVAFRKVADNMSELQRYENANDLT